MWQSRGGGKRKQVQCKISRGCPLVPQQCNGDGGGEEACEGHRKDSDPHFLCSKTWHSLLLTVPYMTKM